MFLHNTSQAASAEGQVPVRSCVVHTPEGFTAFAILHTQRKPCHCAVALHHADHIPRHWRSFYVSPGGSGRALRVGGWLAAGQHVADVGGPAAKMQGNAQVYIRLCGEWHGSTLCWWQGTEGENAGLGSPLAQVHGGSRKQAFVQAVGGDYKVCCSVLWA